MAVKRARPCERGERLFGRGEMRARPRGKKADGITDRFRGPSTPLRNGSAYVRRLPDVNIINITVDAVYTRAFADIIHYSPVIVVLSDAELLKK